MSSALIPDKLGSASGWSTKNAFFTLELVIFPWTFESLEDIPRHLKVWECVYPQAHQPVNKISHIN